MPLKIDMDKSPKAQLEALRNRQKLITTSKWNELEKEAHGKAFTVAKVMSADVLQDIYDYVQSAVKEGWSYDTFKKKVRDGGLVERMQNAGWLKTATDKQIGVRLQVIIDTNVKMAYGKGNYNRLMLVKDKKPYWIYHQVERKTKRAEHSIYNGRKFHCDDPIWNTIYPPSGFRCSCWVEAVAEPDGVESGSNIEINPDEHPISPLSVWKPETDKYIEELGQLLKGALGRRNVKVLVETKENGEERVFPPEAINEADKLMAQITNYSKVKLEPADPKEYDGITNNYKELEKVFKDKLGFMPSIKSLTDVFVPKLLQNEIKVSVNINDKRIFIEFTNKKISIERRYEYNSNTIEHSYYNIKSEYRNKVDFHQNMIEQLTLYSRLGVKTVSVHADITTGCYVWGRWGFQPNNIKKLVESVVYHLPLTTPRYELAKANEEGKIKTFMDMYSYQKERFCDIQATLISNFIDWEGTFDFNNNYSLKTALEYTKYKYGKKDNK